MMFKSINKIIILNILLYVSVASGNNILITQGDVNLTFDDLDGYSYTMPKDKRSGFFNSADRIDQTLSTILKIKHVVNYAEQKDLLDIETVNNEVSAYLLNNENLINDYDLDSIEYLKLKKFIYNKVAYQYMHKHINDNITKKEVIQLAKEHYILNKDTYEIENELRTLQYITFKFNEENKNEVKKQGTDFLKQLKQNKFKNLEEEYKNDENIIFTSGIKDFYFNEKYKKFSEFVFNPSSTGVIEGILEGENTFIIAEILDITEKGYKSFDEVKDSIVTQLMNQKAQLKFGNLISQITQDDINVEKEAILSLKSRYITKE